MPLNVSPSEFVAPGGIDPDENLRETANRMFQRNLQTQRFQWMKDMQTQRLGLAEEGRRDQSGKDVQEYLNDKNFLTGNTMYDPYIRDQLSGLRSKAFTMAAAGQDIPTIMMNIGPDAQKLSKYATTVNSVRSNVQNQIKAYQQNGFKGYNYGDIEDAAMKNAFMDVDPKTGQYTGIKDIDKVDPTVNYVHQAIEKDPGNLTNAEALDQFAKNTPMNKTLSDIKQYTPMGGMTDNRVHLIGQNWLVPDTDKKGVTTGLVPKFQYANDGGKPITQDVTDKDGNVSKEPVRLLDEGVFDNMMKQNPGIADYIKGQLAPHLKDADGNDIDINDPKAKLFARSIAYDELNRRKSASIEHVETLNKPSAQQVALNIKLSPEGQKATEVQAAASEKGKLEEKQNNPTKSNLTGAMGGIFNNDPAYNSGDVKDVNGTKMIDVSSVMPGGQLKFGKGKDDVYSGVYYDPTARSLTVQKGKDVQNIPENQIGQFITKSAESNGMPVAQVRQGLQSIGYQNGKFSNAAASDNLTQKIQAGGQAITDKHNKFVDTTLDNENYDKLSGMKTPDGSIVEAGARSIANPMRYANGKFYVTVKTPDGKTKDVNFDSKEKMSDYLKSGGGTQVDYGKKYGY